MSVRRPFPSDGRVFRRTLVAKSEKRPDSTLELRSPNVGFYRGAPPPGALVLPGAPIAQLEVLGVLHDLSADEHAHGLVVGEIPGARLARRPVDHGTVLLTLDPSAGAVLAVEAEAEQTGAAGGLCFRSPSSGRFYRRPSPDKPSFVEAGARIDEGQTVCLLEIMKTFHRISFGGPELPKHARVLNVVPEDGADVETGDVLLELEEVD